MSAERQKLILDPVRWYRGLGDDGSSLLRNDGRMCCLGFECIRRGYSEDVIRNVPVPTDVAAITEIDSELFSSIVAPGGLRLETEIAGTNDDEAMPLTREGDLRRIAQLQPFFDHIGVELVLGDDPDGYDRHAAQQEQEAALVARREDDCTNGEDY